MDVSEASALAIKCVQDVIGAGTGTVRYVALEEVEYDDTEDHWVITVGFVRSWDVPQNQLIGELMQPARRTYKVVRISNHTGEMVSIKNRE